MYAGSLLHARISGVGLNSSSSCGAASLFCLCCLATTLCWSLKTATVLLTCGLDSAALQHRVLFNTDVLANATTLVLVASSVTRLQRHLAEDVRSMHFGPSHPLFSFWACAGAYVTSSCAVLGLLRLRRPTYFRHRTSICLAMRLLRLLVMTATLLTPAAAFNIASAVVSRVADNPQKAPTMLVIHPMVFYCQPVLMLLPWQYVLPIQLVSTYSLLVYMQQFPCFLQVGCRRAPQTQPACSGLLAAGLVFFDSPARNPQLPGPTLTVACCCRVFFTLQHVQPDPSTYVWQVRAKLACSKLQSYAAIVSTAVSGGSLSDSTTVCEGEGFAGVQALQIFGTILCLFVLPLVVTYEFERWARARSRHALPQPPATRSRSNGSNTSSAGSQHSLGSSSASGGSGGVGTSGAAGSSSGSVSSRLPPVMHPLPRVPRYADPLLDLAEVEAEAAWGTYSHVCLLLLVLALVLPVCWLLSELLAEWFQATRSCPSVIAAATSR